MSESSAQPQQPEGAGQEAARLANRCPVCGADLPAPSQPDQSAAAAPRYCPNCGAALSRSGGRLTAVAFDDKALVCLPYELEGLARSEAVDGWYLVDTTASETVPGMIEAHFRRASPPRETVGAGGKATTAEEPTARREQRRASRRQPPAPTARRAPPAAPREDAEDQDVDQRPAEVTQPGTDAARLVILLITVAAFLWLLHNVGVAAVVIFLLFLPKLLRTLGFGDGRRRRR